MAVEVEGAVAHVETKVRQFSIVLKCVCCWLLDLCVSCVELVSKSRVRACVRV